MRYDLRAPCSCKNFLAILFICGYLALLYIVSYAAIKSLSCAFAVEFLLLDALLFMVTGLFCYSLFFLMQVGFEYGLTYNFFNDFYFDLPLYFWGYYYIFSSTCAPTCRLPTLFRWELVGLLRSCSGKCLNGVDSYDFNFKDRYDFCLWAGVYYLVVKKLFNFFFSAAETSAFLTVPISASIILSLIAYLYPDLKTCCSQNLLTSY